MKLERKILTDNVKTATAFPNSTNHLARLPIQYVQFVEQILAGVSQFIVVWIAKNILQLN